MREERDVDTLARERRDLEIAGDDIEPPAGSCDVRGLWTRFDAGHEGVPLLTDDLEQLAGGAPDIENSRRRCQIGPEGGDITAVLPGTNPGRDAAPGKRGVVLWVEAPELADRWAWVEVVQAALPAAHQMERLVGGAGDQVTEDVHWLRIVRAADVTGHRLEAQRCWLGWAVSHDHPAGQAWTVPGDGGR